MPSWTGRAGVDQGTTGMLYFSSRQLPDRRHAGRLDGPGYDIGAGAIGHGGTEPMIGMLAFGGFLKARG